MEFNLWRMFIEQNWLIKVCSFIDITHTHNRCYCRIVVACIIKIIFRINSYFVYFVITEVSLLYWIIET